MPSNVCRCDVLRHVRVGKYVFDNLRCPACLDAIVGAKNETVRESHRLEQRLDDQEKELALCRKALSDGDGVNQQLHANLAALTAEVARQRTNALCALEGMGETTNHTVDPVFALSVMAIARHEEGARLKRGDFTPDELQTLCHNLSEQDKEAFFQGCTEYQRKLFGCSAID